MSKITWTLRTIEIAILTDYAKNPRSLTEAQFKQLKTSLDKFGMIDKPIINLDDTHTVIGGHQRLRVLRHEGVKACECWIPDRALTDREVEELNIRLNKNSGSFDFEILANNYEPADLIEWGFDDKSLFGGFDEPEETQEQAEDLKPKSFMRVLISVSIDEAIEVKDALDALALIPGIEIDYGAN